MVWPSSSTESRSRREHLAAGLRVEVAGRLVGEQHRRLADQRAGDGDALLLAAGELRRTVVETVGEADGVDELSSKNSRSGLRPAIVSGSRMFSSAVSIGSRLNDWKMKPTLSRRSCVSCFSLSARDVDAVDRDAAGGRLVEPGEDVHQRRLARARGAHDRGELAAAQVDVGAAQRVDGGVALAVALGDAARGDDRRRARTGRPACACPWSPAAPMIGFIVVLLASVVPAAGRSTGALRRPSTAPRSVSFSLDQRLRATTVPGRRPVAGTWGQRREEVRVVERHPAEGGGVTRRDASSPKGCASRTPAGGMPAPCGAEARRAECRRRPFSSPSARPAPRRRRGSRPACGRAGRACRRCA